MYFPTACYTSDCAVELDGNTEKDFQLHSFTEAVNIPAGFFTVYQCVRNEVVAQQKYNSKITEKAQNSASKQKCRMFVYIDILINVMDI